MTRFRMSALAACLAAACLWPTAAVAQSNLADDLASIREVGPRGAGHLEAIAAWRRVAREPAARLTDVLAGMDGGDALAVNWLRAAVDAIAERQLASGGELPTAAIEAFIRDTSHHPRARRTAYEWLARVDASAPDRLLPGMLNDPALELRRDAVARLIAAASEAVAAEKKPRALDTYREALAAARDVDQIKLIAERMSELGEKVDLPRQFGFLVEWRLVGSFDNTGQQGFDVAYPPESGVDLSAVYKGKEGEISWAPHTTDDDYGIVDLAEAIGKHKGAVAYAYAVFHSDREQEVELRLGCINANKVWVNGELVTANEVYHASMEIDQYVGAARLRPGPNYILLKICQNEQDESWAQRWQFQLRVCDALGRAIHSLAPRPR